MKRRLICTLVALAAGVVLIASGAQADSVSSGWQVPYRGTDFCVSTIATTSHPPAGGASSSAVQLLWSQQNPQCYLEKPAQVGYMILRRQWYAWINNGWVICNDSGWIYNQNTVTTMSHSNSFATAICGATWYGTQTLGYYWADQWKGGATFSSYHWMPS
jgi:hypothetical protein